jgi:hypothetical protein
MLCRKVSWHCPWGVVWNFVDIAEALLPRSEDPKIHLPSKINVHHPRISAQDNGMWIYNTMLAPYSVYALETEISYHLSFPPKCCKPFHCTNVQVLKFRMLLEHSHSNSNWKNLIFFNDVFWGEVEIVMTTTIGHMWIAHIFHLRKNVS